MSSTRAAERSVGGHHAPDRVSVGFLCSEYPIFQPQHGGIGSFVQTRARALVHAAHAVSQPNKVVLGNTGAVEEFARTLPATDGPVAYLCTGKACQPPTSDAAKVKELLR